MKTLFVIMITFVLVTPAIALDPGNRAPDKPVTTVLPPPVDQEVVRQGGDTLLDALLVTLPLVNATGTTNGYNDDYDEVCPYSNSTSPDVVYTFVPPASMGIDIDMFGSAYDTKIYVYDANGALVACNDDFYPDYTSLLENVPVIGGAQYYLVIDGYGGASGDYLVNITEFVPCVVDCPAGAQHENEPPLSIDYVDNWNGGCNTDVVNPPFMPFVYNIMCGRSGWYLNEGNYFRDTDWFTVEIPSGGLLEIVGDAEYQTYMFELGPQDCETVGVLQEIVIGPCQEGHLIITGSPGSTVWFWVGPTTFESPSGLDVEEYDYVLIHFGIIDAVEDQSWSGVKSLFD